MTDRASTCLYPVPKLGKGLLERDSRIALGFQATFRVRDCLMRLEVELMAL